ncbi:MAG: membrane protein insertase YidC [Solirubrobacterales bacterium]|nr:membrane protein insertase YidC [Solirubrobacterales bacterium]
MSLPLAIQLAPQFLVNIANGVLQFFHDSAGLSWGMSIVALTICTRAVLIPLTYKQLKGMRAMQALQPQIKELQAKYKNDKQRMQQEMMRFYKENKVNPFASCLPLLAQLPVFITLFYVLRTELPADIGCQAGECGGAAFGASFLFITDLTAKATGAELIALIFLYVTTQLASGFFMSATADKSQRTMMLLLPVLFVPFILSFPAGLMLYWITTNLWTVGQGLAIKKIIPVPVAATPQGAAAIAASKPPPKPPKKKKKRR